MNKQKQKEQLSLRIAKTALVIAIITGLGTIIFGGGVVIMKYYGNEVNNRIVKPVEQEENYYDVLEKKCAGGSCCLSSLKYMKENNYKEADENEKCPEGFKANGLRCMTSYQWCEPMEKTEWRNCEQDSDCVETQADCCSCGSGGKQIGINKKYLENWENTLAKKCQDIDCIALFNCKKGNVVCESNKCEFKEETNSDTSDWQTYRNEEFGFEVKYPKEFFSEQFFQPKIEMIQCDYANFINNCPTEIIIINEMPFCLQKISRAAAGTAYVTYNYTTVRNKECFKVSFTVPYSACLNYLPIENQEIQKAYDKCKLDNEVNKPEIINQILSTFRFIEKEEAKESDTSDWQTYRNEEFGFEVKYPEEWNIQEDLSGGIGVIFLADVYNNKNDKILDLIIAEKPKGLKIEEVGSTNTKKEMFKINGINAMKEYHDILFTRATIEAENNYILFEISAEEKIEQTISKNDLKTFDQILSSFKFIEK